MAQFCGIKKSSICLDCRKSGGLCSWSSHFEPVKGWDAELVTSKAAGTSYLVSSCPEFEDDTKTRVSLHPYAGGS